MIDDIMLSPRVAEGWAAFAVFEAERLLKEQPDLTAEDIGEEDAREMEDGSIEIFCKVGKKEVKMAVPKSEWRWI
jgi:hypothetical protein